MEDTTAANSYPFLAGGGEMGERTRTYDWSTTTLGTPDQWPLSLRTTLGIVLHSAFPMFLFWGPDLLCFYNDAYRPSLGHTGKHPALGKPGVQVWPEIWAFIGPMIQQVMNSGEPTFFENQLVPIYRNGQLEDVYWTFSYSPAYGDQGQISGVFVTCTETTNAVTARKNSEETQRQALTSFEESPVAIAIISAENLTVRMANPFYGELVGRSPDQLVGKPLLEALPELREQGFDQLLTDVITTGVPYIATEVAVAVVRHNQLETIYVDLTYQPQRKASRYANDDLVSGVLVVATDVTQQVLARNVIEASEARFRSLIEEAPVATCLLVGREMRIDIANEQIIGYWGKDKSVIGKPLAEALPELKGQPFLQLLDEVFTTGKTHEAKAARAELNVGGVLGTYYFNYTYKPLRDAAGNVYAIMNMAVDVTQQVIAQRKLEASETYYRRLTDTVPAIVWTTEPDGYCSYLNKQWYDFTGQSPQEAEGFGWLDATHPDDKAEAGRLFMEANEKQTFFKVLYRLRRKDGSYRWSVDTGSPRFSETGVYEGMAGTVVDVHDQKVAEDEQQKLAAIIEASHEFVGMADADRIIQYGNPAALTMLGWDTVAEKTILDCIYPEDWPLAERLLRELVEKGHISHEIRFLNARTGEPFWLQWNAVTINDPASGSISLAMVSPNITERKKASQALKESEERFQAAIVAVQGIIWTNNAVGQMEGLQPGWAALTGQTQEDYQGYGWSAAVHPDDAQPTIDAWEKAVTKRRIFVFEHRVRQYDGTWGLFSVRAIPLLDANGSVREWVGVHTDITEQRRAAQALAESEQFSSNLFHSSPVANLALVGEEMIVRTINRGMLAMLGRDATIIGRPFMAAIPELIPTPMMDRLRRVLTTGETYYQTEEQIDLIRYGQPYTGYYNYIYSPLHDAEGTQNGVVVTAIEVTQQVMARKKVEESEARFRALSAELDLQVQQRTQELQASVQDLSRSNANLQQFAYVASHDLQEPLRKIQSFGDLLKTQYADRLGEGVDHLDRMQTAASRMSVLIKDLLTFSRISTQQNTNAPISLNSVIGTVLTDLDLVIQESDAQVSVTTLPTVPGDKSQLGQLFQNLLSNALKFRRKDTTPAIYINARRVAATDLPPSVRPTRLVDTYYRIDVADNGIGFDEKYVDRIFQVFQRLHGRSEFAGTGIGLAICEKVAANHGGVITAHSQPGQGATFSVYLPG